MVYEYKQIFRHGFLFALLILLDFSYAFIAQWDKVQEPQRLKELDKFF